MTSPRAATTASSGQRFYTWRSENYWSVTTIIGGGLPKPALINWAKKFTAEYAVEHFKALTELVADDPAGAVEWLKGAAYRDRDRKADLGTAVHEATEAYKLGKPTAPWPLPIRPRMLGFAQFLADFAPEYHATEASVYNRSEHYAGTLDAIVTFGQGPHAGRTFLLDAKTGKAIYPEIALQLAAYRFAEFIGLPDGSEAPMPEVDGCAGLHLPDEGGYELVDVRADEEVFTAFKYVREVYRFATVTSKSVLLGPIVTEPAGAAAA